MLGLGFEVKLIPPAHVKPGACPGLDPRVRRNKNDAADAAAICEAAIPEPMRPISVHRRSPAGAANEGQP